MTLAKAKCGGLELTLNPDTSLGFQVFVLVFGHLLLEERETSKGPW